MIFFSYVQLSSIRFCGNFCILMIFALGFPINNSPNPVQLEAMGTSAYEFKTGDNCKELFSTIIAINNNIHSQPLLNIGCVRI